MLGQEARQFFNQLVNWSVNFDESGVANVEYVGLKDDWVGKKIHR